MDISVNRKRICDFLLDINSNFGRISHHRDKLTFKARKIACFPTPPLFDAPAGRLGESVRIWVKLIRQKLEWYGENFGRQHIAC